MTVDKMDTPTPECKHEWFEGKCVHCHETPEGSITDLTRRLSESEEARERAERDFDRVYAERHQLSLQQDAQIRRAESAESRADGLQQALEAERRDGERYRWLREKSSRAMTGKKYAGQIQVVQWADRTEANALTYEKLDAAIDAAIERGKQEWKRK